MDMKIIKGNEFSQLSKNNIKTELKNANYPRKPGIAIIIVGDDYASQIYVQHKITACKQIGFKVKPITLPKTTTESQIIAIIKKLNYDVVIDGILVQLPLPKHLNQFAILNTINAKKDVDGLTNINAGKLLQGDPTAILPCTVKAIIKLLAYYQIPVRKKNITIINNSNLIGKPLAMLLSNLGATVSITHKDTNDLNPYLKNADIICTAAGVKGLFTAKQVKQGVIIIDIAINRNKTNKVVGDVNYCEFINIVQAITPVPGGIGPVTIAMLLENLWTLFKIKHQKHK